MQIGVKICSDWRKIFGVPIRAPSIHEHSQSCGVTGVLRHPCSSISPVEQYRVSARPNGILSMATCPACKNDVTTPSSLNLSAWRNLVCPHCKARLEMKPPRFALLGPLVAPVFILARQSRVWEVIAFGLFLATIVLLLFESFRPKVQLRKKPLPQPSIRLNIDGPPS